MDTGLTETADRFAARPGVVSTILGDYTGAGGKPAATTRRIRATPGGPDLPEWTVRGVGLRPRH